MNDDGYVMSDKNRKTIFRDIAQGETDFERLVKKARLIRLVADRALKELVDAGLVEREGASGVKLTPAGEDVSRDLKKQDAFR